MKCPACGFDHDFQWPEYGCCIHCGEDMSGMIAEADSDWESDNRRRDLELREDE